MTVDLVADMTVINPFDFFVEHWAEHFPFDYPPQLAIELAPYLEKEPAGPLLAAGSTISARGGFKPGINTVDFLVALNQRLQSDVNYLVRMEPGIQAPDDTLERARAPAATRAGCWCRSCGTSGSPRASCPATSSSSSPT